MNEYDPMQAAIDKSATELLAANRRNAMQEITEMAEIQHEKAASLDKDLTVTQQLGSEAVRLYAVLERREASFMSGSSRPTFVDWLRTAGPLGFETRLQLVFDRRVERYAQAIFEVRDGEITYKKAKFMARMEILRKDHEDSQNKFMQQLGYTNHRGTISADSYEYFAPAVLKTDAETGDNISQQWRATAMLPCSRNKFSKVIDIRHEFKDVDDLKVTKTHKICMDLDGQLTEVSIVGQQQDMTPGDRELFFPLGLLIKSREAVMASLPKKLLKKW